MKRLPIAIAMIALFQVAAVAQMETTRIEGKEVAGNEDVVFRQIDEHTWAGTGHPMYNESLYLVEGNSRAVLIDAGTKIADLDKIVASITKKPVTLAATHAHPDHTGSAIHYFPELLIAPGDAASQFLAGYKGKVTVLNDSEAIDLGGRSLEVIFTPGHTPGSTTFIDRKAGYGFSGDSFGSGNLLLFGDFSTLLATCRKTSAVMEKYGIKILYPGHYFGGNAETKQRIDDEAAISMDVLAGRIRGEENPSGTMGLNRTVTARGVRINYGDASVK